MQIKMSRLQRRHINLVISGLAFIIGMIAVGGHHVTNSDPLILRGIVAGSTLGSMTYLLIWGSSVSPYSELKRVVILGIATIISISFLSSLIAVSAGYESTQAAYTAIPDGQIIFNAMVGVTGLIVLLGVPLAVRSGIRRINGDSGSNGGGTPEERVLSEDEFDSFDHPHEELAHSYAENHPLPTSKS